MNLEIDIITCKLILRLKETKQTIRSMEILNSKIQNKFSKNPKFDKLIEN